MLAAVGGVAASVDRTGVWKEVKPHGISPAPRHAHSATYVPSLHAIIVFGGRSNKQWFNDVFVFDVASRRWSLRETSGKTPVGRAGHSATFNPAANCIFVLGGATSSGPATDVLALTLPSFTWQVLSITGVSGVNAAARGAMVSEDHMLVVGNHDGGRLSQMLLHVGELAWFQPPMKGGVAPPARRGHTLTTVPSTQEGKTDDSFSVAVVLYGGHNGASVLGDAFVGTLNRKRRSSSTTSGPDTPTSALEDLRLAWRRVGGGTDAPSPRCNHAACVHDAKLLVHGGSRVIRDSASVGDTSTLFSDLHILDLETGLWTPVGEADLLAPPRRGHTITIAGDSVFLFGGKDLLGTRSSMFECQLPSEAASESADAKPTLTRRSPRRTSPERVRALRFASGSFGSSESMGSPSSPGQRRRRRSPQHGEYKRSDDDESDRHRSGLSSMGGSSLSLESPVSSLTPSKKMLAQRAKLLGTRTPRNGDPSPRHKQEFPGPEDRTPGEVSPTIVIKGGYSAVDVPSDDDPKRGLRSALRTSRDSPPSHAKDRPSVVFADSESDATPDPSKRPGRRRRSKSRSPTRGVSSSPKRRNTETLSEADRILQEVRTMAERVSAYRPHRSRSENDKQGNRSIVGRSATMRLEAEEQRIRAEREFMKLSEHVQELREDIKSSADQRAKAADHTDHLSVVIGRLEAQLEDKRAMAMESARLVEEESERMEELRKRLQSREGARRTSEMNTKKLNDVLAELSSQLSSRDELDKEVEDERRMLEGQLKDARKFVAEMSGDREEKLAEIKRLQETVSDLEAKLLQAQERADKAKKEGSDLRDELVRLHSEMDPELSLEATYIIGAMTPHLISAVTNTGGQNGTPRAD